MQNRTTDNDFAYIHIRPGTEGKSQPVATVAIDLKAVAINLGTESDYVLSSPHFAVGLASQHLKKDINWNSAIGRQVSRGRAEQRRLYTHVMPILSRRELIISAVCRVFEAVETGELKASRKVTRALKDTITRLRKSKSLNETNRPTISASTVK